MNKEAFLGYGGTGNGFSDNTNDDSSTSDSGDSSSSSSDSGTDGGDDGVEELQRTFTGGGTIEPGEPCVLYTINDDYDDPYLFFSYTMDIQENIQFDCSECLVRWKIYDDASLIKTIIQDEEGGGQTYINNYQGGNIKICVETDCPCDVIVSYTMQIWD
jgi:hypothetical protein